MLVGEGERRVVEDCETPLQHALRRVELAVAPFLEKVHLGPDSALLSALKVLLEMQISIAQATYMSYIALCLIIV